MPELIEEKECCCLDLNNLYQFLHGESDAMTEFGYEVRREPAPDGSDYYDLMGSNGLRLCCDGEQCIIIDRTAEYVSLIDVENFENEELEDAGIDTVFHLSEKEFNTATHGR